MNARRSASSGSSFAGRTAGHEEAFFKALHNKAYPKDKGNASKGERIVIDNGRCVGVLYPGGIFVKKLKAEHILRVPPAIAIQKAAIEELEQRGCRTVRAEIEDGRTLVTPFSAFRQFGKEFNRGFGEQVALLLSRWQDARAVQPDLFGGSL